MTFWRALRRALRAALLALAAVILFIEEWGWQPLAAAVAWLAQWPPLARLEAGLRRVSPRLALVLFLVPALLLFPVKLLALWLIHLGHTALGLGVIVAAKLLGTALVGRLFVLTEPQLMQFAWFARALGWWRATKLRVKAAVLRSAGGRALQAARRRVRIVLRRFGR
ncbi:hypothetical protein ACVNIS_00330 [Sphaerotilaceae bacterium SBD11-9]